MKSSNRNSGEIKDFPCEKLNEEMKREARWNGSVDAMWTNIERGLDERRKAWSMRFRIHLILIFILALILILILTLLNNGINILM